MASKPATQGPNPNVDTIVVQQRPGSSYTDRLRVYRGRNAVFLTVYGYDRKRKAPGQAQIRVPGSLVEQLVGFLLAERVESDAEE